MAMRKAYALPSSGYQLPTCYVYWAYSDRRKTPIYRLSIHRDNKIEIGFPYLRLIGAAPTALFMLQSQV